MAPAALDSKRLATLLASTDAFRRSPSRLGGRGEHKEWVHFLVHTPEAHLLVNFNLLDEPQPGRTSHTEVARLIVLVHAGGAWQGEVERFEPGEVEVEAGGLDARLGRNSLRFEEGTWHLSLALRERPVAAELSFRATTVPALSANHPLSSERHISWLFLPRLVAEGTLTVEGRTLRVERAPAYHDHNWGHFRWGDDFSWEWGSVLPGEASNPWSAVVVRMMDRGRHAVRYQALFLWHGAEPLYVFRDEALRFSTQGGFHSERAFTLPRPLALLAPGTAADIPHTLEVHARHERDEVRLTFTPRHAARLLMPTEGTLEGLTAIHEVLGPVALRGQVRGQRLEMEGPGVFEFVRE